MPGKPTATRCSVGVDFAFGRVPIGIKGDPIAPSGNIKCFDNGRVRDKGLHGALSSFATRQMRGESRSRAKRDRSSFSVGENKP